MNNLKDYHKKNFNEVNERLGITPTENLLKSSTDDVFAKKDVIVFGSDKATCDFVGKVVPVASIAELKRLSGVPADADDSHVEYPEKTAGQLKTADSSDSQKEDIAKAASSYILGNPDKVKHYEDVINSSLFPGKAVLFSVNDLLIKTGQTVILGQSGEPEIYNFGSITIQQGGELSIVGNVQLTCQVFTQL